MLAASAVLDFGGETEFADMRLALDYLLDWRLEQRMGKMQFIQMFIRGSCLTSIIPRPAFSAIVTCRFVLRGCMLRSPSRTTAG